MQRLKGLGVSGGIAFGRALVLTRRAHDLRYRVSGAAVAHELHRLAEARGLARRQLAEIKARIAGTAGAEHAYLFDAQLLMLDDPMLVDRAAALVTTECINTEWALQRAALEIEHLFDGAGDAYLLERKGDVADLVGRLQMNLLGEGGATRAFERVEPPCVIISDQLPPSIAAQVDWTRISGFATDAGSWTYHTAILARSLRVPAVVGLHDASRKVAPGTPVVLDGGTGDLLIDPEPELVRQIEARERRAPAARRAPTVLRESPAITADGVPIRLAANIELPGDVERAREYGADGIGLYRSEFLLGTPDQPPPDEDAQYLVYRELLERMAPHEVTIRTFDVSAEKADEGQAPRVDESSNRLGLRGLRYCLAERAFFRTQLRALGRAAQHGTLRVMFPMVSTVDELRDARTVVAEAQDELRARGLRPASFPLGAMIEVPAAALASDLLAREAEFFSIGTNDLIQYALAVERNDDRVSYLYDPLHPAVLRLIRFVLRGARMERLRVSVCGEMASDPLHVTLLIGLGITEFSMTPAAIPVAKQVIRDVRARDARRLALKGLRADSVTPSNRRSRDRAAR
jgi:phosphoenolpyruvate-protein phosphotransferase (PTS system enzyme I)